MNRSFLRIPEEYGRLDRARFVVLPVPWERAAAHRKGTQFGPEAVLSASKQVELFDEELWFEPWKAGVHTLPPPASKPNPEDFVKSLSAIVEPHLRSGKIVFTVGGEHAISEGPVSAAARVHPELSVLHLDAHCGLLESFEGSPFGHACSARRMGLHAAKIVQVGVRSMSAEEEALVNTKRVRTFFAQRERDMTALIPRVLEELGPTVYVSIDLDALDPSVVPGVGLPVPGGLGWWETLDLLRAVVRAKNVVAADAVELRPLPDGGVGEIATAKLLYRLMGYLAQKESQRSTVRRAAKAKGKR